MKRDLKYYWRNAYKIEGWFDLEASHIISMLNKFHHESGIKGDIFEIGVHHGKMTIFLGLLLDKHERIRICDIFDDQSMNISESGAGSKSIFLDHWQAYFGSASSLNIFEKASKNLSIEDIGKNYRVFSIDGGHTADETYQDLNLARLSIQKKGFILVDDYFDPVFPGVSEGVNRFLIDNPEIKPLMYFFNKLLLVQKESWTLYENYLKSEAFGLFMQGRRLTTDCREFHGSHFYTFRQFNRKQFMIRKLRDMIPVPHKIAKYLETSRLKQIYAGLIRPRS